MEMECDAGVDWVQARLGLRGMGGWKVIYEDVGGVPATYPGSVRQLDRKEPSFLSCPPGCRPPVSELPTWGQR